jgi:hypothetical protein
MKAKEKARFCLWVDLRLIAENLSITRGRKVFEWEARHLLLSIGKPGKHEHSAHPIVSPFTPGEEPNRFYCVDEPSAYFERDELLKVVELTPLVDP